MRSFSHLGSVESLVGNAKNFSAKFVGLAHFPEFGSAISLLTLNIL